MKRRAIETLNVIHHSLTSSPKNWFHGRASVIALVLNPTAPLWRRESRWPQRRILCAPLSGSFRQRPVTVGRVRLFSGLGGFGSDHVFSIGVVDSGVRDDAKIADQILSGSRIVRKRLCGPAAVAKPSH